MIPYEELVYALQNWRAKQGLPVTAAVTPGSGPARTAPPPPPGSSGSGGFAAPPPIDPAYEDSMAVDDALIEEAPYDAEADVAAGPGDFAMDFGGAPPGDDGESTSIGGIPSEDGVPASDSGQLRGTSGRNEDW